jgi:hypothetical protein
MADLPEMNKSDKAAAEHAQSAETVSLDDLAPFGAKQAYHHATPEKKNDDLSSFHFLFPSHSCGFCVWVRFPHAPAKHSLNINRLSPYPLM